MVVWNLPFAKVLQIAKGIQIAKLYIKVNLTLQIAKLYIKVNLKQIWINRQISIFSPINKIYETILFRCLINTEKKQSLFFTVIANWFSKGTLNKPCYYLFALTKLILELR